MFTPILILISLVFLIYSIFVCRKMITTFVRPVQRKAGNIMMALMIILFLGYTLFLIFGYDLLYGNFMASMLFFFTAFFVMLVVQLNYSLIIRLTMKSVELKEFSEKLLKETKSLSSSKQRLENIKAILEQKNTEMHESLKKWSSWRISIMKKLEKTRQKQVQEQTQQTPEKSEENKPAKV